MLRSYRVTSSSTVECPCTRISNFQNSTLWNPDTTSGLGGWGDPNNDNQITDGAFANDFTISYPVSHRPRLQYTPTNPIEPGVPLTDQSTHEALAALVNSSEGGFIGFQAGVEEVCHGVAHHVVGGYTNLLNVL